MRFISTQQKLSQGLSITERVIGRNLALPILQNTLLSCNKKNGLLTLLSTDLEMGVEVQTSAKIEEEGSVAVPTKLLNDFVKNLPNENIEFSEKGKRIFIHCGNYQSNMKGEDASDFPLIPNPKDIPRFILNSADFLEGISSVINSVSLLDIKPEISGILIQFINKDICFTATDSFRLSEKVMKIENKNTHTDSLIVPRKVCDMIGRVFQGTSGLLHIETGDNQVIVKNNPEDAFTPRVRFVGKIIDGEYPDYEQIIPKEFRKIIEVSREGFVQRVRTAGLFSNKISEVTLWPNEEKQELRIIANDQERGDYLSAVPCKVKGTGEKISFNFQYLLDGMQNINSPNILIKMNEPTTPALIEPQEDEGFRYLIMPIRV